MLTDGSVSARVPLTPCDEALITNFAATRGRSREWVEWAFHIVRERRALGETPDAMLAYLVAASRQRAAHEEAQRVLEAYLEATRMDHVEP